jgi:hypothetical protein
MMQPSITPVLSVPGDRRWRPPRFIFAFLFSSMLGIFTWYITDNGLDLFLGAICLSAITVPSLWVFAGRSPGVLIGMILGIGASWLLPVSENAISFAQWILCLLVLASVCSAIAGLIQMGISPGIVVIVGIAWLTWPIWLSVSLPGRQPDLSVLFHPLFATNHVLEHLGIWTEQQGAYGLTNLGQDVQYQMPASAWPAILFHLGIAGVAWVAATFIAPRSINQIDPDASAIKNK